MCDFPDKGKYRYFDVAKVIFDYNLFIVPNIVLYPTVSHVIDAEQRARGLEMVFPINVGNDVLIDSIVSVLGGVSIGNNTIISPGN